MTGIDENNSSSLSHKRNNELIICFRIFQTTRRRLPQSIPLLHSPWHLLFSVHFALGTRDSLYILVGKTNRNSSVILKSRVCLPIERGSPHYTTLLYPAVFEFSDGHHSITEIPTLFRKKLAEWSIIFGSTSFIFRLTCFSEHQHVIRGFITQEKLLYAVEEGVKQFSPR